MSERRREERFEVCLDVVVEGATGRARVADLSEGGCYIDTLFETYQGEILLLKIKLPTGEWLELEGEVAHIIPHLGVGIRFIDLEPKTLKKIAWVIRDLGRFRHGLSRRLG
jgi:PilZ domain